MFPFWRSVYYLPIHLLLHLLSSMPALAQAQDYPSRAITLIVPLVAGGGPDTLARILAARMATTLGQPIVVENIPTAAGTVGVARLARALADGYTIGIGDQTSNLVSSFTNPVQYDVLNDFEPIALLSTSPIALVARRDLPAENVKQLIAWLREKPERGTAGTFGQGSGPHIIAVDFQNQTGTTLRMVPYRGTPLALQDVISGQIDLLFVEQSNMIGALRGEMIKAYAVLGKSRSKAIPQVPTMEEAGGPALDVMTWRGMWAPKSTPPAIIGRLVAAVVEALGDTSVQRRIADISQEIVPRDKQTPQALAAHHKAEIEKWLPMIKAGSAAAAPMSGSTEPRRAP